MIVYFLLIFK